MDRSAHPAEDGHGHVHFHAGGPRVTWLLALPAAALLLFPPPAPGSYRTGAWRPEGELGSPAARPPVLDAATVRRIAEPSDPYGRR
ncbi:hypothetical protein ABTY20_11810 [Streptomyces sp. NPDC126497]|uniref:hypothetical protein n=1 Tax=Streptomyces sp. NPDC126497 TaxID=3155313 RepID=UPI00332613DE